jgi:hypothetical protein
MCAGGLGPVGTAGFSAWSGGSCRQALGLAVRIVDWLRLRLPWQIGCRWLWACFGLDRSSPGLSRVKLPASSLLLGFLLPWAHAVRPCVVAILRIGQTTIPEGSWRSFSWFAIRH